VERIQFIDYHGHKVLLLDFSNASAEEVAATADRVPALVTAQPLASVLLLADFTSAQFTRAAVERIKVAAAFDRAHVKRSAWVHADTLPKTLYDSIRSFSSRDFPIFPSREEALVYLVS
jgi:hypothetical protein